jgi:hypothetical protein
MKLLFIPVTVLFSQTISPVRYWAKCFSWGLLKIPFNIGRRPSTTLGYFVMLSMKTPPQRLSGRFVG